MTTSEQAQKPTLAGVPELAQDMHHANKLWVDAWKRLIRNRAAVVGLVIVILSVLIAIFAPYIAPNDYREQVLTNNNSAPRWVIDLFPNMKAKDEEGGWVTVSEDYILGADNLGRDLLSRIIYGSRVSLSVAFVGPMVSLAVGLILGLVSGYAGGRVDNLIMRLVDIMYAFPTILLVILLMAYFRATFNASDQGTFAYRLNQIDSRFGGMLFIFIGIGLTSWMNTARLARGQVLSIRQREYIEAATSVGASDFTIIFRHILPNILGPIVVAETLTIPTYISFEAFLSFIGLGVNPPTPSWGSMIADGAGAISSYPHQAIFPSMALFLIMFAFNFLGDGLRDALDPHMSRT